MPSTYTSNTGIEKPGSGEQSGTWGTTTNTNFDIIDQALHGQASVAIFGDTDLTTNNGSISDGANTVIILTGSPGATFELRVTPTDQEKYYNIRNETDAACRVIYKGVTYTTSNGVEIAAGASQAVTGDGGGASGVFKSLKPSTNLVNDLTPQLGGNLDVNAKNILFGDSGSSSDGRLVFGSGSDLEIYHDASHSFIRDSGQGYLYIATDTLFLTNDALNEVYMKGITNGAVELYHNNVKKIETTADGVDITGDISLSGGSGWGISVVSSSATANSNGAVSSSTALTVDGNSGTIVVGMSVTGTGISGSVKVATVTSQTELVLDTAITIADDVALQLASNNLVFSYGGTAVAKIASDGAITSENDITAFGTV